MNIFDNQQSANSDDFFLKEEKLLDDFRKSKQLDVIEDASQLFLHFNEMFDDLMKKQKKTNVLITGITGAGKSTLINSIFGKKLALTGIGEPITQHFIKYTSNNFTINFTF